MKSGIFHPHTLITNDQNNDKINYDEERQITGLNRSNLMILDEPKIQLKGNS